VRAENAVLRERIDELERRLGLRSSLVDDFLQHRRGVCSALVDRPANYLAGSVSLGIVVSFAPGLALLFGTLSILLASTRRVDEENGVWLAPRHAVTR